MTNQQRIRDASRVCLMQTLSDQIDADLRRASSQQDFDRSDVLKSRAAFLSQIRESFKTDEASLEQFAETFLVQQVLGDDGQTVQEIVKEISALATHMQRQPNMRLKSMGATLGVAALSLDRSVEWSLEIYPNNPQAVLVGAVPFLKCARIVLGAWLLGKQVAALDTSAEAISKTVSPRQLGIAAFYFHQSLPVAAGLSQAVRLGEGVVQAICDGLNDE